MHLPRFSLGLFTLFVATSAFAADQNLRVGTGAGCTHADVITALNAIRTQTGTHTIRINKGTYAMPDGTSYSPTVSQTAVFIEGGYDNCTAATPTGSTGNDADLAVLDGAGGTESSVLSLGINGQVQTFQIRRVVIRGGEVSGLIVNGQASVLLGVGTKIKFNATPGVGGGVVLNGALTSNTASAARIDLYIDEGAEITNNTATDKGGGVFCGNLSGVDGHASIVFRDGIIGYNQADEGAAFYCRGTVEVGGGFQPRPRTDRAALIIGNQSTANGAGVRCAAGFATLDMVLPVQSDGFRHVGADPNSNGLLAVVANSGTSSPALCLTGSRTWGAVGNPAPAGQSRFRLRNFYMSDQFGDGFTGLSTRDRIELIVEPSGTNVSCSFFSPTPCVRLTANSFDVADGSLLTASGASILQLRRALLDSNASRSDLALADDGAQIILYSSILDNNTVANRTTLPSTASLFAARFGGSVDVNYSTIIMRSALTQFFRLGWAPLTDATGTVYTQASAFSSTVGAPLPVGYEGGALASSFRRYWCGYFANTSSNFTGHTIINDPGTGTYALASSFAVDANYVPTTEQMRDACSPPTGTLNVDYYGRTYNTVFEPGSPVHADLGAVEAQLADPLFSNGFE